MVPTQHRTNARRSLANTWRGRLESTSVASTVITTYAPFPAGYMNIFGIGTDITECLRIARMIERHGELFINRVYTPEEIRYCQNRKQSTQHFAGRWAAKEAILKALGTGWRQGISWLDMEIRTEPGGQPKVLVRGGVKELVEQLGVQNLAISVSHCRTHAVAYAIAMGDPIEEV